MRLSMKFIQSRCAELFEVPLNTSLQMPAFESWGVATRIISRAWDGFMTNLI